jgi:hypothetical protein
MNKKLFFSLFFIIITISQLLVAQTTETKKNDSNVFDENAAFNFAKAKGIKATEINGYVQFLKNEFSSKKALQKQGHVHSPYESSGTLGESETVIYLEPNKPMSLGCQNMGFEQYNFTGWTGGSGITSAGVTMANYGVLGTTILNGAGNNVSLFNTTNYHTLMTVPPIDHNYPFVVGYDSLACKAVGSQTISQIPFVSPFSFDPVSVRMNGAVANNRACRLKYIATSSTINQRLSFSYAVVLQNAGGHSVGESPYFKVEVKNESTGVILSGCPSYTFNTNSTLPSDSIFQSTTGNVFDPTIYRKWQNYSIDLSTLPLGTNISINFEVGGCSLGGHWAYAYVDAECGGLGTPYANWCSGTSFATLVAPTGFNSYQWSGSGGLISGATNDTLQVAAPIAGAVYTVSMVSPGGCVLTQTVSIPPNTTVNIINLNSTSSCANGSSGTAYVQANGSNGIYTYQWTSTSGLTNGNVVSTSQTASGLSPGTYSVLVSSTTCGQTSANLSVGISPLFFLSQNKPFCGKNIITIPGGSNYRWYEGTTSIPGPIGTNDSLDINSAVSGDFYTVAFDNAQGCRDSIKYTLALVAKNISGIITSTTSAVNGDVILYKYSLGFSLWDSVTTVPFTNSYTFNNIDSALYVVRALPNSTNIQVTYGDSSVSWQNATIINHGCAFNTNQHIKLLPLENFVLGPGVLTGSISEGLGFGQRMTDTNKPLEPGNPIGGIIVKGGKNPGGQMFVQTTTAADGTYTLSGLPINIYEDEYYFVLVDIPGLDTNGSYYKVINPWYNFYTNLDFIVDSINITPLNQFNVNIHNIITSENEIKVFPNPATDNLSIQYKLKTNSVVNIELFDILGNSLKSLLPATEQSKGVHKNSWQINELSAGLYFIKISINGYESTIKLSVTK